MKDGHRSPHVRSRENHNCFVIEVEFVLGSAAGETHTGENNNATHLRALVQAAHQHELRASLRSWTESRDGSTCLVAHVRLHSTTDYPSLDVATARSEEHTSELQSQSN